MKKERLFLLLIMSGLLVTTTHITPAQQAPESASIGASRNEDCGVPVTIFGAVISPSRYELRRKLLLIELIALAGGVTNHAKGTIQILHTEPNTVCERLSPSNNQPAIDTDNPKTYVQTYNLTDVLHGGEKVNPYMRPGDIVTVLELDSVYVTGNVVTPQRIYFRDRLTVSRAIAMCGGFLPDALKDNIYIYRQTGLQMPPITINLKAIRKHSAEDLALQQYDIVEVVSRKRTGDTFPILEKFTADFPLHVVV